MATDRQMVIRSDIKVVLDDTSERGDKWFARRAWVEPPGSACEGRDDSPTGWKRLITTLLKGRHGTPFEGGYMSVYVEAPAAVWWQWVKHRFMSLEAADFGCNLESGRYKVLVGQFYTPPKERPCQEPAGFKPMRPILTQDDKSWQLARAFLVANSQECWQNYCDMIDHGVSREVARFALPFNVYYSGYVSANPRTWLHFFSLRRKVAESAVPTFPQWEIENACEQCELLFAQTWPLTYEAFVKLGRLSPN
jgi:thymidylate synthase (FAD)